MFSKHEKCVTFLLERSLFCPDVGVSESPDRVVPVARMRCEAPTKRR